MYDAVALGNGAARRALYRRVATDMAPYNTYRTPARCTELQTTMRGRPVSKALFKAWLGFGLKDHLGYFAGDIVPVEDYVGRLYMLDATCCTWASHVVRLAPDDEGDGEERGLGAVVAVGTQGGWVWLWRLPCGIYSLKGKMTDDVELVRWVFQFIVFFTAAGHLLCTAFKQHEKLFW